jgi:YQGE family putative transporter
MIRLRRELEIFQQCSHSMRTLMISNMIYALVLPVIEVFVAAFVMRNSHAVDRVVTYQLSVYAATPFAFYLNGRLMGRVEAKHLYAAGMFLSGVVMMLLMRSSILTLAGTATAGLAMGVATGLFWANRGFLALATTDDGNRNYYYGVELFTGTLAAVAVPGLIGWFIGGTSLYGWLGGVANQAYRIIAVAVFVLTVLAAGILELGSFRNPPRARFVFFRFHPLWRKILQLAVLKGLAQGYILTAPAMLIMLLVGQEGTLGATQAIGGVLSACILYAAGRIAMPAQRMVIFSAGLLLFFFGAVANAILFNAIGVLVFVGCLLLAKPLLDLGYNPLEFKVVDVVAGIERRSAYAYLFNHEFGLFPGRLLGCGLFLAIAHWGSPSAALRYALLVVAGVHLISIPIAGKLTLELGATAGKTNTRRGSNLRA